VNTVGVELPENLTIGHIHPLHEMFEALVDEQSHDHITLDGAKVQRVDTAAVQLLQAFVIAAKERQLRLEWINPSPKLTQAVDLLGMKSSLGLAS
jgi:anti-anti-sigma regulatory factor